MYWIEIHHNGSYIHDGREYPINSDEIEQCESHTSERNGNEWEKYITPFIYESVHGTFKWHIELIEYFTLNGVSMLSQAIVEIPKNVAFKDDVLFVIQDGWINYK